jgi:HSP20 family protein
MMTAMTRRAWDPFEWVEHLTRPGGWIGSTMFGFRIEDESTDEAYILRAELPGIDPEKDVQVSVTDGVLTVHAERKEKTAAAKRSEFRYGELSRSVTLPTGADADKITAKYADGVLEVIVPITKPVKPQTIPITRG